MFVQNNMEENLGLICALTTSHKVGNYFVCPQKMKKLQKYF